MAASGIFNTIILITICQAVLSLRLTKINIPQYKLRGENAILECDYELNGNHESNDDDDDGDNDSHLNYHDMNGEVETLYSIKWYKDGEEFYRFVPKSKTPQNSYKVDGVKVDSQSNSKKIILKGLTLKSTGVYKCEVSAEEPDFKTVTDEGKLEVIYPATSGPTITPPTMLQGEEKQYQIGDILSLNCTSGRSQPRSILTFYINDEAVADSNYLTNYRDIYHNYGLITTTLGLNIPVDGRHFYEGIMRVRCVSNLLPALQISGRESLTYRRLISIENREAMLLVRSNGRNLKMPIALILIAILLITTIIV